MILQNTGLRTNDIRSSLKPFLKHMVFLNEEMTMPIDNIVIKKLDMDIISVMYFLLAMSL